MTATLLGALATAGLLGVTHAIEPDHVAGVASLTGEYGDARLSALVGACFSLGHVALVGAWLALAYALLGATTFPASVDALGTAGAAVVLGVLGAAMAVAGLRAVVHDGEHAHGGTTHSHPHLRLAFVGGHDHSHTLGGYLKTGLVGALFTLSPPASMIAFASTLLPSYGPGAVGLAVLAYAVAITATMSLVGAGAGAAFGLVAGRERAFGLARVGAGVLVVGFAGAMLFEAVPALA